MRRNTGILISDPDSVDRANIALRTFQPPAPPAQVEDGWSEWVTDALNRRYANSPKTLQRCRAAWDHLRDFIMEKRINRPGDVAHKHRIAYVAWRQRKSLTNRRVGSITTIGLEVRLWGMLLREAVDLGLCTMEWDRKLRLPRKPQKRKPEISFEAERAIRAELERFGDEDMETQFIISINQGTRLTATRVHLERDVDWKKQIITFHEKGGVLLTQPMAAEVYEHLKAKKASGAQWCCAVPYDSSKRWKRLFKRIGLNDLCFHTTRVTKITRLHRKGVPLAKVMEFVGHSSPAVHKQYQRLNPHTDLWCCVAQPEEGIAA